MVNLIKNSGFEDEPLGINWIWTNASCVYDTPHATHAAKLNPNGSVTQTITLQPNTTYSLQFYARPWRTAPVTVNAGGKILSFPVTISDTYVSVAPQTFTTGSSPTNSISFTFIDTIFLDRIDLELVGASATYDCIGNQCILNTLGTGKYTTSNCNNECQVQVLPPVLTSITPNTVLVGTFTLTAFGSNFSTDATIVIYQGLTFIVAGTTKTQTSTSITSEIILNEGIYEVKVKNADGVVSNGIVLAVTQSTGIPVTINWPFIAVASLAIGFGSMVYSYIQIQNIKTKYKGK